MGKEINIKNVNEIFDNVIESIDHSRNKILDLVTEARLNYEKLVLRLENLKAETEEAIQMVDTLEIKDKLARKNLATVSKNFRSNTEADIKQAYEKATEIRIDLKVAQSKEKALKEQRTQIELDIKAALSNIHNAEQVVHQVSVASSYLKGEILEALEEANFGSDMMLGVRILEAQENERQRISRDIHDGPAQRVANIVMKADLCEKIARKNIQDGLASLSELREASREALREVREIIYNLRPMALDDLGLNKTIEMNVTTTLDKEDIRVEYQLAKLPSKVEKIIQVAIFRITQEILNNIKKHAKARNIMIKTEYGTKYMRLTISDDGIGFDVDDTLRRVRAQKKSYGLIGIMERVDQLQGEFNVESSELGTIFNIKLPINREVILDE
ncbi:sensor histidine kinase [Acidaminobacter sp. JC074]|uniref:sensor histidine kinase n=1 Tax=Acidaminobacter sp. JC074 TaxID=2530199 RepID=UPI001F0E9549|nr:sensor histidine kinase [Acidaminobacter sp. JC074]MCH4890434.1 sensor histidine kinase [Acidaminobacter sp. JC074]